MLKAAGEFRSDTFLKGSPLSYTTFCFVLYADRNINHFIRSPAGAVLRTEGT